MAKERSPFGELLRAHRLRLGLSQEGLSQRIDAQIQRDPALAELGGLTAKAISNLESSRDPARFVRPRPLTVRLLATTLGIAPGSPEETAFLAAADATRERAARDAASAATHDAPDLHQPHAAFIPAGREDHLQHLQGLLEKALAGHPQIALLAGEPGVGKTWLITEICRLAQHGAPEIVVAWGECTGGAAAAEPYLPFRQALAHVLGGAWGGPGTAAAERRAEVLEDLLSQAPALVGSYIDEAYLIQQATEIGVADAAWRDRLSQIVARRGGTDMQGRFDQVAHLVATLASRRPLILVLEDLHWADERTCALLFHLQRRLHRRRDVPVLIVGSYRPSDLVPQPDQPHHPLEPVINEIGRYLDRALIDLSTSIGANRGRAFIDALLDQMLDGETGEVGDILFARTKGYPLFAVELLRWLRETGAFVRAGDGRWRLTANLSGVTMPGRVRAVIAGRLARLPEALRRILSVAAVQGSLFTVEVVAGMLQLAPDEVDTLVDDQLGRRHRLVSAVDSVTVAGKRLYRYRFVHALYQEYLYETLTTRERERLHGDIAACMTRLLGAEAHGGSAEIAFHYEHAGDQAGAAAHALQAGRHANQMAGYEIAADWFLRTIALGEAAGRTELIGRARNGLAGTLRSRGESEEGARVALCALEEARRHGHAAVAAESQAMLGLFAFDRGRHEEAATFLRDALAEYRALNDLSQASGVESLLSHACFGLGAYDEALAHARGAHETAVAIGNDGSAAESLMAAANCEVDLGRYAQAIDAYREAATIYRRAGDLRGEAICQLNTSLCLIQLGTAHGARDVLATAKSLCVELRLLRLQAAADHYLGLAHEAAGDMRSAAHAFVAARDRRRSLDQEGLAIDAVAGLLRLATARDERERMRELATEVDGWIAANGVVGIEDPITVYLSCAAARRALGEDENASAQIEAGRALLLERAGRIADPDARRSYLERVPANRALLAWRSDEGSVDAPEASL